MDLSFSQTKFVCTHTRHFRTTSWVHNPCTGLSTRGSIAFGRVFDPMVQKTLATYNYKYQPIPIQRIVAL
jgi:hypothetical protein